MTSREDTRAGFYKTAWRHSTETGVEDGLLRAWNVELQLGLAAMGDGDPMNVLAWRHSLGPI